LKALTAELTRLGYTEEDLRERLDLRGAHPAAYFSALADPPLAATPDGRSPLDWLIYLFLLRQSVPRPELARLLSEEALQALEAVQLVQTLGGQMEATCALLPFGGLYLCADRAGGRGLRRARRHLPAVHRLGRGAGVAGRDPLGPRVRHRLAADEPEGARRALPRDSRRAAGLVRAAAAAHPRPRGPGVG